MKRVVVGGLPEPIGGITSFILKLAENNMVSEVIDIYPSANKRLPKPFTGKITELNGALFFFYLLLFKL